MTATGKLFAMVILALCVSLANAGVRHPEPGAGADVLHQQDTGIFAEEDEEEEDDEPDCE